MGTPIYSILYLVALAFLLPYEYLKRPQGLRKRWLKERFGLYEGMPKAGRQKRVWVHAVSVGEVIASVVLIKKLKERYPSLEVVVSTVTDTGQKVAGERIGTLAKIVYVPFDLPVAIGNALDRINPSLFIIMETELWPAMIGAAHRRNVPVVLMNGRISEGSFKGYSKLKLFLRSVLNNMDLLCVQNELYAERLRLLGAAPQKVKVIGSFKFDTTPSAHLPQWTTLLQGPVIIAGSTHRPEEELILNVYAQLKNDFPKLNIIVAPRHPERFKEVEELIRQKGLDYVKRSEMSDKTSLSSGLVILLDVIGELASTYGAADLAIMGGTFIEHGGQNPLEPAYWEKAIVCGPHMENFPFIEEFYIRGGALEADASTLYQHIKELLASPEKMASMGKMAKELYQKNAGATERAVALLERYLR